MTAPTRTQPKTAAHRHAERLAWARYLEACTWALARGTYAYDRAEPMAWSRLERELATAGLPLLPVSTAGEGDA